MQRGRKKCRLQVRKPFLGFKTPRTVPTCSPGCVVGWFLEARGLQKPKPQCDPEPCREVSRTPRTSTMSSAVLAFDNFDDANFMHASSRACSTVFPDIQGQQKRGTGDRKLASSSARRHCKSGSVALEGQSQQGAFWSGSMGVSGFHTFWAERATLRRGKPAAKGFRF